MNATVLIVDDEPAQRRLLESHLGKMGYRVLVASDGEEAIHLLQSEKGREVTALVLDLIMPGLDGMGTLGRMKELGLQRPTIVQTAKAGIDTVVSAMRAGATDFCVKPVSFERLKISLANAIKLDAMEHAVRKVERSKAGTFSLSDMIANSPAMEQALSLGKRAAASTIPVLIEGESGTGKEVLARAIHGAGDRSGKPLVTVNCGALPETLAESILFGHEKGAFTGATSSHVGKFKEADGGTLFLDEVGELSPELQVKLLRAIQEGEIDPVGGRSTVKTDFRLISATNRDMIDLVTQGGFREDLFYRINVFPIRLPALRRRKEDIAALVSHFIASLCLEQGRRNITGIRSDALNMLAAYDWPGNIRQLENAIFRAIVLCDGDELTIGDFPQIAQATATAIPEIAERRSGERIDVGQAPPLEAQQPLGTLHMLAQSGKPRSLAQIEEDAVRFAISHHKGRMTAVARSLGIGRSTLYRKLKEYDIDAEDAAVADSALVSDS
ncbi:MAG: sigma-54 dependent transcriptional regulator [Ahrensia sp.]|nr:sigma-54 dependent transcriptional regulator [Ahrensia sp.]